MRDKLGAWDWHRHTIIYGITTSATWEDPYLKQITNKNSNVYYRELYTHYSVMMYMGEESKKKSGAICVYIYLIYI